jgi:glutamyl-tRNA reductase
VDLAVLHRESPCAAPSSAAVWRTCLREIEFLHSTSGHEGRGTLVRGSAAYALLLEVICGLRSPLTGETQVQGQFRAFLTSLDDRAHAPVIQIGQQLLADAKRIRETHLRGLGARSYGAAVRRHVRDCRRVAIIGAGALSNELLSWVAEGRAVDRWVRPAGVRDAAPVAGVSDRCLGAALPEGPASAPAALVVAAPVTHDLVRTVASNYTSLLRVIDLRGEVATPLALAPLSTISLADLFAEMGEARQTTDRRIAAARAAVGESAARWASREQLHPFGWDDLCAWCH